MCQKTQGVTPGFHPNNQREGTHQHAHDGADVPVDPGHGCSMRARDGTKCMGKSEILTHFMPIAQHPSPHLWCVGTSQQCCHLSTLPLTLKSAIITQTHVERDVVEWVCNLGPMPVRYARSCSRRCALVKNMFFLERTRMQC